jgi:uncharacterized protein
MKLHASTPGAAHIVTAYGDDYVTVKGVRYTESIVLLPERVAPWSAPSFEALTAEHFSSLLELEREIVILGTGPGSVSRIRASRRRSRRRTSGSR